MCIRDRQEPLLTLYDLFGFSAEERRQAELGISKKRNSRRGATVSYTHLDVYKRQQAGTAGSHPDAEEKLPQQQKEQLQRCQS